MVEPALRLSERTGAGDVILMRITGVTRAALLNALRQSNYWWGGDLEEEEFLSRFIDLDAHPSYDERFKTLREDLLQHRINNPGDWESEWVFNDPRVGLDDDGALLRFLAETLHPEVRTDTAEVEALAGFYNHHLRPDGIELYVRSRISGRPVYAPRLAVAPAPTPKEFPDGIADCIASFSVSSRIAAVQASSPGAVSCQQMISPPHAMKSRS